MLAVQGNAMPVPIGISPSQAGNEGRKSGLIAAVRHRQQQSKLSAPLLLALALALTLSVLPARAADPALPTTSRVTVLPAEQAPVVDGGLADACWPNAAVLAPFVAEGGAARASEQTVCRLAWDEQALYASFLCQQQTAPVARVKQRDAAEALGDDSIGLVLLPPGADRPVHIVVTAGNVVYDALGFGPANAWDAASLRSAVAKTDRGWQAEVSIAWADLGAPPTPDAAWRIAALRFQRAARERSAWPYMRRAPYEPWRLAEAKFVKEGVAVCELRIEDGLGDLCRPAQATLRLRNRSSQTVRIAGKGWIAPPLKEVEGPLLTLAPTAEAFLPVTLPAQAARGNRATLALWQEGSDADLPVFADIPLRPTFLRPRVEQALRELGACEEFLLGVVSNLEEIPGLLERILKVRQALRNAGALLDQPGPPTSTAYEEARAAVATAEEQVRALGMQCAIIASYAPRELTAGKMGRKHLLWPTVPFSPLDPQAWPEPSQVGPSLRILAVPGQSASGSFCLLSGEALDEVVVECTQLRSALNILAPRTLDMRVVRTPTPNDDPMAALLVKDDRAAPEAPEAVRGSGPQAATTAPAGATKQFYLTVNVPRPATPGVYLSVITAGPQNGPKASLPVEVRVVPFDLQPLDRNLVVDFPYSLSSEGNGRPLALMTYQACLQDIACHGFTQGTLRESPEEVAAALSLRRQERLTGPVPYSGGAGVQEMISWLAENGPAEPPMLLPVPPFAQDPLEAERLDKMAAKVASTGAGTIATLLQAASPPSSPWAEVLAFGEELGGFVEVGRSAPPAERRAWYYWWDATRGSPLRNRLLCGLFLWASPFDGVVAYSYESAQENGPPAGLIRLGADGPTPTLAWEACREGVQDLRFLQTLQERVARAQRLLAEMRKKGTTLPPSLTHAAARGSNALALIHSLVTGDPEEALRRLPADSFHAFRAEMASCIVLLDQAFKEVR
jgi:hypothetical protein